MTNVANLKRWALLAGVCFVAAGHLMACNTPVFQQARKERPETYFLFECRSGGAAKQGPQGEGAPLVAPDTGRIVETGKGPAPNLARFVLDLSRADDPGRRQLEETFRLKVDNLLPEGSEPRILVLWPLAHKRQNGVFWSEPVKDFDLQSLIDSPARRELARQLLQRRVLVWLFVPGGEKAEDERAEGVLRESLKQLEEKIELPASENPAPIEGSKAPPAQVKPMFAVIRFVSGKPEERYFERMLCLEGLWEQKRTPLVFAICGRGRVMGVLAGEDISSDSIEMLCAYVCGPCSFRPNPGYDLLMRVDWAAELKDGDDIEKALAPPPGLKAPGLPQPTR